MDILDANYKYVNNPKSRVHYININKDKSMNALKHSD